MPVFAFDSIISYFCACFRANFIIYRKFFPVNPRKIEKRTFISFIYPPLLFVKNLLLSAKTQFAGDSGHIRNRSARRKKNEKADRFRKISCFLQNNSLQGI